MSTSCNRGIAVRATVTEAYDGLLRLVGDAQRFGFVLRQVRVDADRAGSLVRLDLLVPTREDLEQLAARFSRHPCTLDVRIDEDGARAPAPTFAAEATP